VGPEPTSTYLGAFLKWFAAFACTKTIARTKSGARQLLQRPVLEGLNASNMNLSRIRE
jgi:hypothetical protein